jgi:hypothetical protein
MNPTNRRGARPREPTLKGDRPCLGAPAVLFAIVKKIRFFIISKNISFFTDFAVIFNRLFDNIPGL